MAMLECISVEGLLTCSAKQNAWMIKMYVYLLRSKTIPSQTYVGMTHDLKNRLVAPNSGKCIHTSKFKPWKIITATWFENKEKAAAFEKYLKHGSGHAFAKRHFW